MRSPQPIDGVTVAPLNKQAMFKGGWRFPDDYKMFAHLLNHTGPFSEMNVLEGQWMTRVTSHVSLKTAVAAARRHRRPAYRGRGTQPPCRRRRTVRHGGDRDHPAGGRCTQSRCKAD